MKSSLATLLLLSLNFLASTLSAQSNWQMGSVTLSSGEVLVGQINDQEWASGPYSVQWRENKDGKIRSYSPGEVNSFKVDDRRYFSEVITIESNDTKSSFKDLASEEKYRVDTTFVQLLIGGEKNLFRYQDRYRKEHFLVGTPGELTVLQNFVGADPKQSQTFRNVFFRRSLLDYLDDCPTIENNISSMPYGEKPLREVFSVYYDCLEIAPRYLFKKRGYRLALAPILGFGVVNNDFRNDFPATPIREDWPLPTTPIFGIGTSILTPSRRDKFRINLDLLYTNYSVAGIEYLQESSALTVANEVSVSDQGIQLNVGMDYDFYVQPSFRLFFGGGLGLSFYLDHKFIISQVRTIEGQPPVVRSTYEINELPRNGHPGVYGDLGARFSNGQVQIRYHYLPDLYTAEAFRMPVSRISLLARYNFFVAGQQ